MFRQFVSRYLVAVSLTLTVIPAFAGNDRNYTYLALGDSVAFGLDLTLFGQAVPPTPSEFTGYPEIVARAEHLLRPNKLANAACPGDTSSSFLTILSPDNGCNSPHPGPPPLPPPFKVSPGLHAAYTDSQMDFAVSQLKDNKHINLVTLGIGGDDLLLLSDACANANPAAFEACVAAGLGTPGAPGPVLTTYATNLVRILTAIRDPHLGAGYKGTLVLVTYYSPTTDPLSTGAIEALNAVMVQVGAQFRVKIANGFKAFQFASHPSGDPCTAGLLVRFSPTTCDVHPSLKGSTVLAGAVLLAIIDEH
jgi:lysophospholipase L1-like esterase